MSEGLAEKLGCVKIIENHVNYQQLQHAESVGQCLVVKAGGLYAWPIGKILQEELKNRRKGW